MGERAAMEEWYYAISRLIVCTLYECIRTHANSRTLNAASYTYTYYLAPDTLDNGTVEKIKCLKHLRENSSRNCAL